MAESCSFSGATLMLRLQLASVAFCLMLVCGGCSEEKGPATAPRSVRPAEPKDGRTFVSDPPADVAKYVGLIYYEDPRPVADRAPSQKTKVRIGTGFLVSDQHIVTAAHVIYSHPEILKKSGGQPFPAGEPFQANGFASNIYFAPGQSGDIETPLATKTPTRENQPFGAYRVVEITNIFGDGYVNEWRQVNYRMHDMVVLKLDRSTTAEVGGYLKYENAVLAHPDPVSGYTELQINGYDGDLAIGMTLPDGSERTGHWQLNRKTTLQATGGNIVRSIVHEANLECPCYGGASGAPVWTMTETGPVVVGLITNQKDSKCIALLFTTKHVDFIKGGISP